jgi:acyl-CoA thioesterase I
MALRQGLAAGLDAPPRPPVVRLPDLWLYWRMHLKRGLVLGAVCVTVACGEGSDTNGNPAGSAGIGSGGTSGNAGSSGSGGALEAGGGGALETGGTGAADAGASVVASRVPRPNPIISRGARVVSSPAGNGAAVVDGAYHTGGWAAGSPTADASAWVAIELPRDAARTRLLVSWDDAGTYNYQDVPGTTVYGLPAAYRIEVSADSSDGSDGTWQTQVTVADNSARTRAHAVEFAGQSWVKLVVTGTPAAAQNGVNISEIDLHDTSASAPGLPDDTWLFMGDSITSFAYDRAALHDPSFARGINQARPAFYPAMINGGYGGETTAGALARLPQMLSLSPDYRFIVLGYGTNDAAGGQIPTATFKSNLQAMIDLIQAAGREPVIPHIPPAPDGSHAGIPAYNTVIDELTEENQLIAGADLYEYFTTGGDLFVCPPCSGGRMTDNLHPNDDGLTGMNATWSAAMLPLYPSAR